MQRKPLLAMTLVLSVTALLIAWRPWPHNGRWHIQVTQASNGYLLDTASGRMWLCTVGQGGLTVKPLPPPGDTPANIPLESH